MDKKFGSRVLWQKALGNEPFGLHVSRTGQDVYLTRPGKLQVSAAASSLARGVFVDPTDVQALMMTNPEKVAEIRKVMQEQLDGWEQKGDLWDRPGIGSSGIGATVTEHAKATKRGYGFEL